MDDLVKKLTRNLARTVYWVTRSKNSYRRIRRLLKKPKGSSEGHQGSLVFPGSKSNAHGFTLYSLGIDPSRFPRFIDYRVMEEFLYRYCFPCGEGNSIITAFRNPLGELDHTGINISAGNKPLFLHQLYQNGDIELTTIDNLLRRDRDLASETTPEYFKINPTKTPYMPVAFTS